MKEITKFQDEISGNLFDTIEEATKSENKNRDIKISFDFYNPVHDVNFMNGKYSIKHTEEFYNRLTDTLISMITKYEPWIIDRIHKSLTRKDIKECSIIGRFLDDSNSNLYRWWTIQYNICPVCFKEFGQRYYTLRCNHNSEGK